MANPEAIDVPQALYHALENAVRCLLRQGFTQESIEVAIVLQVEGVFGSKNSDKISERKKLVYNGGTIMDKAGQAQLLRDAIALIESDQAKCEIVEHTELN